MQKYPDFVGKIWFIPNILVWVNIDWQYCLEYVQNINVSIFAKHSTNYSNIVLRQDKSIDLLNLI